MIVFLLLMFLHYKTEMVCCIISVLTLVFFNKSFLMHKTLKILLTYYRIYFAIYFELQKPNQLQLQTHTTVL